MKAGALQVTFIRDKRFSANIASVDKELTEQDRNIVLYIQKEKEISVSDLAKHLGISLKSAQRLLSDLVKLNVINAVGENRWRRYIPAVNQTSKRKK